jgi:hypothetical protein
VRPIKETIRIENLPFGYFQGKTLSSGKTNFPDEVGKEILETVVTHIHVKFE